MKRSYVVVACLVAVALALVPWIGALFAADENHVAEEPRSAVSSDNHSGDSSSASSADAASSVEVVEPRDASETHYEEGMALVALEEGADSEAVLSRIADLPELNGFSVARMADDYMKIALPAGIAVEDAVELLLDAEGVAAAQPNYRYHTLAETGSEQPRALTAAAPADTTLSTQATSGDPNRAAQWALASMNVPAAWNEVVKRGASHKRVSVAVLDSGFLVDHEDLKDVVVKSYNAVSGGSDVYNNEEDAEHGTHVAGIIAAQANNGKGVAGVAYNTSSFATCGVVPICVANRLGDIYTDTLVDAYKWLRKKKSAYNIRVVNMSLGGDRGMDKDYGDTLVERQINAAWNEDIVTVAAAGNIDDGWYNMPFATWPSDSPNVISVINLARASNADGVKRSSSSNFNVSGRACKDISAPGTDILSTWSSSTNAYQYETGTSMASPAVAGVVALMFKANPKLTAPEAASKLFSTAKDLTKASGTSKGWDRASGYGEADAAAAVSASAAYLSGTTTVSAGKYSQLNVKVNGKKQSAKAWRWSSSNTKVARVSSTGRVTGVASGDVVITAKKGSKVARQTMTVSGSKTHVSSLSIKVSSRAYIGKACTPNPVVRDGSVRLVKGRDYKVSYSSNKKVGIAKVKVTGIAPYYGSTTKRFTIKPAATSIASLKGAPQGLVVKWKRRAAQTTGYQLQLATDRAFKQGRYTFQETGVSTAGASVESLESGKRYYVRVRTYKVAGGETYYSSWSKVKSVITK